MKNELESWEVGLADQLKGKEFSFDPQAFADFENLLQAESLGHEPGQGQPAPTSPNEVMTAAASGSSGFSLPTVALVMVLIGLGGWWLWSAQATVSVAEPTTNLPATALPSSPAAPATLPAPAAAPQSSTATIVEVQTSPSPTLTTATSPSTALPLRETGVLESTGEEPVITLARPRPADAMAVKTVAVLPLGPVNSIRPAALPQLKVRKPIPEIRKRDRKALFPDIIEKH